MPRGAHLDLSTREFHVTFKEGFTPKDREERTVPFGQELCEALRAYKRASGNPPDSALVFPHNGKVHRHIIRNLKQCARVAGLRGDWYLHRFRHTLPLIRRGIPVVPVEPGGKRCLLPEWPGRASALQSMVESWHGECPDYNVGCVAQPDGIVILDCDVIELHKRIV
jgi:hypothetical protein